MASRWWEYYAIRYFVGSAIGAFLILYLNGYHSSGFGGVLCSIGIAGIKDFSDFAVLASVGFAFCYLSSAPILVFHAYRAHLSFGGFEKSSCCSYFCIATSIVAVGIFSFIYIDNQFVALLFTCVTGFSIGLTLAAFFDKYSKVEEYYKNLSKARVEIPKGKRRGDSASIRADYITSYKHLREHGNAFLIVVFEFILAFSIFHSSSKKVGLIILALWVVPSGFVWLLGSVLERKMVNRNSN
ncbi:hypothetical protein E8K88_12045 [Lampropedia aestuarii]|uniref:Uncharacterized protein n=1 Tax=Lampropedia aestuarii TaxID=2562762 RepID=A0A4S5BJ09_9BURK|nr:hypothetical protein [Lampropedia aestuarii]THJ32424.1 hypothetical protein E8K88_12045 [Lampropedia aestuarii]